MHRLFGFILSHCGGRRCALPPAPPHPLLFFNRLLWLPTLTLFFWFILSLLVSIETCAYVLLSWYALRGEALRPPPAPPHPLLCFNRLLLLPTLTSFLHMHRLFGFILSHCGGRRLHPPTRFYFLTGSSGYLLSLFFSGSFYLYWYPSRLVPMCFFLGTHCGGRCCALPPAPPHPLLCFNRLLLLPTLTSFLHMHRLFGFILSHCRGRRLHPPTRFDVLTGSGCSLLSLFFSGSCYLY